LIVIEGLRSYYLQEIIVVGWLVVKKVRPVPAVKIFRSPQGSLNASTKRTQEAYESPVSEEHVGEQILASLYWQDIDTSPRHHVEVSVHCRGMRRLKKEERILLRESLKRKKTFKTK
jgi:hypothetical protein